MQPCNRDIKNTKLRECAWHVHSPLWMGSHCYLALFIMTLLFLLLLAVHFTIPSVILFATRGISVETFGSALAKVETIFSSRLIPERLKRHPLSLCRISGDAKSYERLDTSLAVQTDDSIVQSFVSSDAVVTAGYKDVWLRALKLALRELPWPRDKTSETIDISFLPFSRRIFQGSDVDHKIEVAQTPCSSFLYIFGRVDTTRNS